MSQDLAELNEAFSKLKELPPEQQAETFASLKEGTEPLLFVRGLTGSVRPDDPLFQNIKVSLKTQSSERPVKSVGICIPKLRLGGAGHLISLHVPILLSLGCKVVLITDGDDTDKSYALPEETAAETVPATYEEGRFEALKSIREKYQLDLYIDYSDTDGENGFYDALLMKALDVKVVMVTHRVFSSLLYYGDFPAYYMKPGILDLADKVMVFNHMDEEFYKSIGLNSVFMTTPTGITPELTDTHADSPHVLWLGRLQNSCKNYFDCLEICRRLIKENENLVCDIVGPESDRVSAKIVTAYIEQNELKGRLIWHGAQDDVKPFFERATVQLCTSAFESLGMALAEGKCYGVPLVSYDLPCYELLKDNKGCITVTQKDIEGAVNAVEEILDDKERGQALAKEAYESAQQIPDIEKQTVQWAELLKELESIKNIEPTPLQLNMRMLMKTGFSMLKSGKCKAFCGPED